MDLWHVGQSVRQPNGSLWALAPGYGGAGNGLNASEEQRSMEQVAASSLYHPWGRLSQLLCSYPHPAAKTWVG